MSVFHEYKEQDLPTSFHSYPKIYNIGHGATQELFLDNVVVQEKIDGSQISFGRFGQVLRIRSKGQEIDVESPPKMFERGVCVIKSISAQLVDGWTYRGEYLEKPKHNTLAYDRTPLQHIILFDINTGPETYVQPTDLAAEASRLGFESVPHFYSGKIETLEEFTKLLAQVSCLGGQSVEGIVVKNYSRFGRDKKALMGKFVSEAFKEMHQGDWRERNPAQGDIIQILINKYTTDARWAKAVQHLKEKNLLENSPKDIGLLIKEVQEDVKQECEEEIKAQLFAWVWNKVSRALSSGLPQWYKTKLLESAFSTGAAAVLSIEGLQETRKLLDEKVA